MVTGAAYLAQAQLPRGRERLRLAPLRGAHFRSAGRLEQQDGAGNPDCRNNSWLGPRAG